MLKHKTLIVSAIMVTLIFTGCAQLIPQPADEQSNQTTNQATSRQTTQQDSETTEKPQQEVMEADDQMVNEVDSQPPIQVANAAPVYEEYSEDKYNELLGNEPFALFFHAPWCPTCRSMESAITEGLSEFPEGTVILKTDYDSETALKEKYGINSQSIIVVVDENGDEVDKLVAPSNKTLQESIQKTL